MSSSLWQWLRNPTGTSSRSARKTADRFRLALDALETREVPAVIMVTTDLDEFTPGNGTVSLREAIMAVNAGNDLGDSDIAAQTPGTFGVNDTINFNIPGAGIHTIEVSHGPPGSVSGPLEVTKPVLIDGYSQPGASPNTLANSDNAVLLIELSGVNDPGGPGLTLSGGDSTVQGLIIDRFEHHAALLVTGDGGNVIRGNFIGEPGDARGNGAGVVIYNSDDNTVGGINPADRNVITGNGTGVSIEAGSARNLVQGNFIGTNRSGNGAPRDTEFGNQGVGVNIVGSSDNTVGGFDTGGNVIAFNKGAGVQVLSDAGRVRFPADPGSGNAILGNSIFSNGGLGIDLGGDGVTPNDKGDIDEGANDLQNVPVITSAVVGSHGTIVHGKLYSTPNTYFHIEFFASDAADPSGSGEGRKYLGFVNTLTDQSGKATFSFAAPGAFLVGKFITATATDIFQRNTSEFSAAVGIPNLKFPVQLFGGDRVTGGDGSLIDGSLVDGTLTGGTLAGGSRWGDFFAPPDSADDRAAGDGIDADGSAGHRRGK